MTSPLGRCIMNSSYFKEVEFVYMSCHSIGRGLNSVMEVVVELYEEGKIPAEAVRLLGQQAMRAVNYCDGNADEAVEVLTESRCGRCLKKVASTNELFNVYEVSYDSKRTYDQKDPMEVEPLASPALCADCFTVIVGTCLGNPEQARKELLRIEENRRRFNRR